MKRFIVFLFAAAGVCAVMTANADRMPTRAVAPDVPVTFSNQVVRIFQNNCQTCHRPQGVAPFSLKTYEESAPYAEVIREKTAAREMPPWNPRPDCGGGFVNERRLSDADLAALAAWADAGAPEGDKADLPPDVTFPDEWQSGEPDTVFAIDSQGYDVPSNADGKYDRFRCFSLPTDFKVDRFVTGFEILRGKGVKVHHALIYLDVDGKSVELDKAAPGPGYDNLSGPGFDAPLLGGWNPGAGPVKLPDGTAIRIPAGSRLVLQVHYESIDKVQHDQTRLGLHFSRVPVRKTRATIIPKNEDFLIPAGDPYYRVDAETVLTKDMTVLSSAPHMHRIGKEMYVEAILPNGETKCLITVDWDIHWQGTYTYKTPISLPAGTRIHVTAYYDNTDENLGNPNHPPKDIPWFPTEDTEMCFCTLGVTSDVEQLQVSSPVVSSVKVKGSKLAVSGADVRDGAFILVNGKLLKDTSIKNGNKLMALSAKDWEQAVPKGVVVKISVLNPDGASSTPIEFTRK